MDIENFNEEPKYPLKSYAAEEISSAVKGFNLDDLNEKNLFEDDISSITEPTSIFGNNNNRYQELEILDRTITNGEKDYDTIKQITSFDDETSLTPSISSTKEKISSLDLATLLFRTCVFGIKNKKLYVYNPRKGIFEVLHEDGSSSFDSFVRKVVSIDKTPIITKRFTNETYKWLMSRFEDDLIKLPESNDKSLVAFANGTLHLDTGELRSHSWKHLLTVGANANYYPYESGSIHNTIFYSFLKRLSKSNKSVYKIFRYVIAIALSNIRNKKTAFFVVGPTNNGKTLMAHFLENLLGENSCSSLSLSQFTDFFKTAEVYEKTINLSYDESVSVWNQKMAEIFKLITSGDSISAERKFEHPFKFKPHCLLISFQNDVPTIPIELDAGNAVSKRIFIIPTCDTIPDDEQDPDLFDKILLEKDVIVSWAMEELLKTYPMCNLPNKIISPRFTNCISTTDDSYERWRDECINLNAEVTTKYQDLYLSYSSYIDSNKLPGHLKERAFAMKLAKDFGEMNIKGANGVHYYKGVEIIHN